MWVPPEVYLANLRERYVLIGERMIHFLGGLYLGDRLRPHEWDQVTRLFLQGVPDEALRRYEDRYRQLSADVPEFGLWTRSIEHQATRGGLAEVRRLLELIGSGAALPGQLDTISRLHRSVLERPVAETGDVPDGMRLPTLDRAYITPSFRARPARPGDDLASNSSWEGVDVRRDLPAFLADRLSRPQAARRPILVLGQPGAGKSLLTKVLSAQLAEASFLPIRVPLREVKAAADIQQQIEQAIYHLSGERLEWPAVARAADGVLPVVLLDGFDELLQATGVRQSDYLEKVVAFQERELTAGRAVAVVVTSRTAVADRAHTPDDTVVVRLEPFDQEQVGDWLRVWNDMNAAYFAESGLSPLAPAVALAQPALAEQPLLLLMLALYDADGNALTQGWGLSWAPVSCMNGCCVASWSGNWRRSARAIRCPAGWSGSWCIWPVWRCRCSTGGGSGPRVPSSTPT